jgi:hypothetical protein
MLSKLNLLFFSAGMGLGWASFAWAGDLPAVTPLERYQAMLDQSPFALASQAAPPSPATEAAGFAKDFILTGIVRLSQGEFVSIATRDQSQRFSLSNQDSYHDITIASVEWSDSIGKTKVTLKKGSEYGVIGFDEALLAAAAQGTPTTGVQGAPPSAGNPPLPPNLNPVNTRPPNAQPPRGAYKRPRTILSGPPVP